MEFIISFFGNILQSPGSKGIFFIGLIIGFWILRLWTQNFSVANILTLLGISGGGATISGIVGYLIKNNLFIFLDAYGLGLFSGLVINILLRFFAVLLGALTNFLQDITGMSKVFEPIKKTLMFLTQR
jgi:hypothetical protein